MCDWFFKEVQEVSSVRRFIDRIRDSDATSVEGKRFRTMSHLRDAIKKETHHNQVRSNDAATKNGAANAPVAIAEAKAKEEEAKQQKAKKQWIQTGPNQETAQRPAPATAAAENQHDGDGGVPPPAAYETPNAKGGQGSKGWQGHWSGNRWKGGREKKGDKGKGGK